MSKVVLIVGASGFIGQNIMASKNREGLKIVGTTRKIVGKQSSSSFVSCDLRKSSEISELFAIVKPNIVIHLAFEDKKNRSKSKNSQLQDLITENLIQALIKYEKKTRLIFLGSCDEYGISTAPYSEDNIENPQNAYGMGKLRITRKLLELSRKGVLSSTIIRPSIVYGPGKSDGMLISEIINHVEEGKPMNLTGGSQLRDFLYISDLVEALYLAMNSKLEIDGEIFNIASGKSISILDLTRKIQKIYGSNKKDLLNIGASPYRNQEVFDYRVDIQKAREILSWEPKVSLEEGLRKTIRDSGRLIKTL